MRLAPVLSVFVLALLVRLVYLSQYLDSPLPAVLGVDHQYYLAWARALVAGEPFAPGGFEQGPLYACFLAAVFRLLTDDIAWIVGLQLALGAALPVLLYACGRHLFDSTTALLAGLLAALYGPLVFYEGMPMKSFLSPLLSVVVLWAGLRYRQRPGIVWMGVAGCAIGLATLVRENHLLLVLPMVLWILTSAGTPVARVSAAGRSTDTVPKLMHVGVMVACLSLVVLPAIVYNSRVNQALAGVTVGTGEVLYLAYGPSAAGYYRAPDFVIARAQTEHSDFHLTAQRRTGRVLTRSESSQYWTRQALRHITDDPLRAIKLIIERAWVLSADYEVPDNSDYGVARKFVPILAYLPSFSWIFALGLFGALISLADWRRLQLPLGIAAVHIVTIVLLYNFGRFRIGLAPLWILFATHGALVLFRWLTDASRPRRRWAALGALSAVALVFATNSGPAVPLNQRAHSAMLTGILAHRSGDHERAERELRRALSVRRTLAAEQALGQNDRYALARNRQALARVLLGTGNPEPAFAELRAARQVPLRDDVRHEFLVAELLLVHQAAQIGHETLSAWLADGDAIVAELRALRPDLVETWALSAVHADPDTAGDIGRGLQGAWQAKARPSLPCRAWYEAGLAFLHRLRDDAAGTRHHVREALRLWPDHPLYFELARILHELDAPRMRQE